MWTSQAFLDRFHVRVDEVPVLICRGMVCFATRRTAGGRLPRLQRSDRPARRYAIVIVVGAGPAGLAAAVYARVGRSRRAGRRADAPGGQAGSSSRIENYLGFPTGISGQELAGRAYTQAQKFGARRADRQNCA